MSDYLVTTEAATVYKVRPDRAGGSKRHGWADAAVRSWPRGGSISIQSDYGTFANSWHATGDGPFLGFLTSLDFHYFMQKASPGYMRHDHDKSVRETKLVIIDQRRHGGGLTRDAARACWDHLDTIEQSTSESYFIDQAIRCPELSEMFGGDYSAFLYRSPDSCCLAFWDEIWPALCDAWRVELARMAA